MATDGRRPEAVCQDVISRLVAAPAVPAGTSTVLVSCTGGTYNVHVGAGLLGEAGPLLPSLPYARTAVLLAAAADNDAAATLGTALGNAGLEPRLIEVPDSQRAKDLATVARLSCELADLAVHNDDLIVGVGGEVVCDLAGFVASTYNRGMPLALVPTTLAAQADSAVGGKASLNLPQGRNLLGTVHQPVAVVSDVGLATVGRREYAAGLAEVVKHALISGGDLVGLLRERAAGLRAGDPDVLAEVVARSVRVKAGIVSGDEREAGDRLHLNYGHTFGHAIEQVSGPDVADDGEAVAIGMMAAAYLARSQGRIGDDLVALHRELLTGLGLPVSGRYSLASARGMAARQEVPGQHAVRRAERPGPPGVRRARRRGEPRRRTRRPRRLTGAAPVRAQSSRIQVLPGTLRAARNARPPRRADSTPAAPGRGAAARRWWRRSRRVVVGQRPVQRELPAYQQLRVQRRLLRPSPISTSVPPGAARPTPRPAQLPRPRSRRPRRSPVGSRAARAPSETASSRRPGCGSSTYGAMPQAASATHSSVPCDPAPMTRQRSPAPPRCAGSRRARRSAARRTPRPCPPSRRAPARRTPRAPRSARPACPAR